MVIKMTVELMFDFDWLILIRLLAAAIAGGVIGIERGGSRHEAGLRTHMLVCLGSAAVMVISECIVTRYGVQEQILRMGAQVISGVGFLGAGCIIVDSGRIRGITTAAGLWTTACLGLVIGSGLYIVGAVMLAVMVVVIYLLRSAAHRFERRDNMHRIEIEMEHYGSASKIIEELSRTDITVRRLSRKPDGVDEDGFPRAVLLLDVAVPYGASVNEVIARLSDISGVMGVCDSGEKKAGM